MNEQNFEYLKNNIKYMGFGEKLFSDLEQGLKSGAPEFQLKQTSEISRKPFDVTLNFRKSNNGDTYFFNSYHASLKHSNGEVKDQVFYLNKGKGVTAKEAYNLLEGRAVYKELATKAGEPYRAWIQLDFEHKDKHNNHEVKQYHEAYGYDLKGTLSKYAVSDMDGGEREKALLASLQRGNLQSVGMLTEVGVTKMFMEANPQFKTVGVYDSDMQRVPKEGMSQYVKEERTEGKEEKQGKNMSEQKEVKAGQGLKVVKPSGRRTQNRPNRA